MTVADRRAASPRLYQLQRTQAFPFVRHFTLELRVLFLSRSALAAVPCDAPLNGRLVGLMCRDLSLRSLAISPSLAFSADSIWSLMDGLCVTALTQGLAKKRLAHPKAL